MIRSTLAAAVIAGAFMSTAFAADTPSAPGTQVYIIAPKNGDTLSGPVRVQFGLKGMGVAPAGTETEGTGHHHLVIDKDAPPLDTYLPIDDPQVMHFGKGQTEVELKLAPGKHTLQLVFADKDHKPHAPPVVSEKITITVK
ncbi:MAG: DUF4399 domain-containing protein [Rhodospirillaceae bacterium]